MWLGDVARIASEKTVRMAQRLRDYRGTDVKRVHSDWSTVVTYQQAQIECVKRVIEEVITRLDGHTGIPSLKGIQYRLEWPSGTVETETLPPVKFTHEAEFHAFVQSTRERLWQCGQVGMDSTPGFDADAAKLAKKLFGRPAPVQPNAEGSIPESL